VLITIVLLPIAGGIICFLTPNRVRYVREAVSLLVAVTVLTLAVVAFQSKPLTWGCGFRQSMSPSQTVSASDVPSPLLVQDDLSGMVLLGVGFFSVLIALYSVRGMAGISGPRRYYTYFLWTIGAACGAALANDLILLLVMWGFLGLTLYLLISLGEDGAETAAKKTFILVGASDSLMILGIGIVWLLTGRLTMDAISVPLDGALPVIAFLCLAAGAFAKAGAMPLHTWIPDAAEKAPIPVTAFLPAALDKLLGIYLLARVALTLFVMTRGTLIFLMAVGALTIIAAVMMALIQHDFRRLLGYHAVSQVGYMVLGIGTGTAVGVAGGLFHMLNNAVYKSCLFLSAGNAEKAAGTRDLDRLGGLARPMPVTFFAFLVAALSISGVPPLNGFFSKWMVYQGVIEARQSTPGFWVVCLVAAVFGSALTLASFAKLTHSLFLGTPKSEDRTIREAPFAMWLPPAVLALLCILFGIFAIPLPLKVLIYPAIGQSASYLGVWNAPLATLLILAGIVVGAVIYLSGGIKSVREEQPYLGGEVMPTETSPSGVDFYQTISDLSALKPVYRLAEKKVFDVYDQGLKLSFRLTNLLRKMHTGVLTTYISWCLLGLIILLLVMLRG
jgi:NADH:ubiquinone oxidoreductase subunit 5 (subunit L)/multisubunit Na+/H+ antiporter MnhA subunit